MVNVIPLVRVVMVIIKCGARIIDVTWISDFQFNITVGTPDSGYAPQGLGHFTFGTPNSDVEERIRFLKDPEFFNNQQCDRPGPGQVTPFTSTWIYDPTKAPPKGSDARFWISVYWKCEFYRSSSDAVECNSEDISGTF
ncbi:11699_t:CDS:2, partial [Racocetra fulgida]